MGDQFMLLMILLLMLLLSLSVIVDVGQEVVVTTCQISISDESDVVIGVCDLINVLMIVTHLLVLLVDVFVLLTHVRNLTTNHLDTTRKHSHPLFYGCLLSQLADQACDQAKAHVRVCVNVLVCMKAMLFKCSH